MEQRIQQLASRTETGPEPDAAVDLNTASEAELEALPGIGPALARRIVQSRQEDGPFQAVEDITRVRGIGQGLLARLSGQLTVTPPGGMMEGPEARAEPAPQVPEVPELPEVLEEVPLPLPKAIVEEREVIEAGGPPGPLPSEPPAARPAEAVEKAPPAPEPPAPPPSHPPAEPARPMPSPWWGLAKGLVIIAIATALATAFSLGAFYSYNGTLDFSRHQAVLRLGRDVDTLEQAQSSIRSQTESLANHTNALEGQVSQVDGRVGDVEELVEGIEEEVAALDGRTEALEGRVQDLAGQVSALQDEAEALRTDVEALQAAVSAMEAQVARFDAFLTALRDLLIETQGTPIPTATPTRTPRPTETPAPSPTPTPRS